MKKILLFLYPEGGMSPVVSCLDSNSGTPHKLCDMGERLNSLSKFSYVCSGKGVASFKRDNAQKCLARGLAYG